MLTIKDIMTAEKNGIKKRTIYTRMRNGYTKEEAINTPKKRRENIRQYYPLLKQKGISESLFHYRIYVKGMTIEEALEKPVIKRDPMSKVARENGIKLPTYHRRIKNGWTKEDAATIPPLKRGEKYGKKPTTTKEVR